MDGEPSIGYKLMFVRRCSVGSKGERRLVGLTEGCLCIIITKRLNLLRDMAVWPRDFASEIPTRPARDIRLHRLLYY